MLSNDNTAITTGKLNDEPIDNYYYNHLRSMNDIHTALDEVFVCEIKPFRFNFKISGVFEDFSYMLKTNG